MRTALVSIMSGFFLLTFSTTGFAEVNCGIVMKSVKMGRSAQDIADTMMISTSDIEKCKAEAEKEGQPAGTEKPVAEKAPTAPAAEGDAPK